MAETKDVNKVYDEFTKAIHNSRGKANNSVIFELIDKFGCTAEDVSLVANKTKNSNYLNENLARYGNCERAVKRLLSKTLYSNQDSDVRKAAYSRYSFRDYGWYFKYVPEQYKDLPTLVEHTAIRRLFENDDSILSQDTLSLYCYNYVTTLLERDNYPSKLLCDRLRDTKGYQELVEPYNTKNLRVLYDCNSVWSQGYEHYMNTKMSDYMDRYRYDNEASSSSTLAYIKKDKQLKLLEQVTQLDILCTVMMHEIYTDDEIENGREYYEANGDYSGNPIGNYMNYLLDNHRKTGARKRGFPQASRLELFSQTKTLEMLLGMGLGIKCKSNSTWDYRTSNKKLLKRVQTAYKTFVKSKTVDDRKAMRKLLKDQANIIMNDFMGGNYKFECVELNCVEEQDKAFENNASQPVVKTARATSHTASADNATVVYARKTFDLTALASATTKTVEKARNGQ